MKKIISLLSIVVLFTTVSFAQKIGFVDSEYILKNIPAYQAAQDRLDKMSVDWQKEIETLYAEIDKLYKDFQAEKVLLTEEMKTKRENQIIEKEKEVKNLQKQYFGKEGDLYKKRQELIKPIQDDVYNAIKTIATEGSYAVFFDTSSAPNIMFSDPKFDRSDEVLAKLGFKK